MKFIPALKHRVFFHKKNDKTIKWVDNNGGQDAITLLANSSSDAPYDLFYDFIEQYQKDKNISTQ
jgi:hypothetical protein